MLHVHIPDAEDLRLEHLVMDVNGTLSDRGALIDGVAEPLRRLAADLALLVLSADMFGTAEALAAGLRAELGRVHTGADKRAHYIEYRGARRCVAVGNGANDVAMFRAAAPALTPSADRDPALMTALGHEPRRHRK
jgi:soluble P-type ATPase